MVGAQETRQAETQELFEQFRSEFDGQHAYPYRGIDWKIIGYPSVFLLYHHGTIRKRWIESPLPEELAHVVGVLVDGYLNQLAALLRLIRK